MQWRLSHLFFELSVHFLVLIGFLFVQDTLLSLSLSFSSSVCVVLIATIDNWQLAAAYCSSKTLHSTCCCCTFAYVFLLVSRFDCCGSRVLKLLHSFVYFCFLVSFSLHAVSTMDNWQLTIDNWRWNLCLKRVIWVVVVLQHSWPFFAFSILIV